MSNPSTTEVEPPAVSETSKFKQELAAKIEAMPVGDAPQVRVPKKQKLGWEFVKGTLLMTSVLTAFEMLMRLGEKGSERKWNKANFGESFKRSIGYGVLSGVAWAVIGREHNRWVDKVEKDNQNIQSSWADKVNDMKSNLQQALWSK
jgi:hypothetical protein